MPVTNKPDDKPVVKSVPVKEEQMSEDDKESTLKPRVQRVYSINGDPNKDKNKALVEAYKAAFPNMEIRLGKHNQPILSFESAESATQFFTEQAKKNISFLSQEVTLDDKGNETGLDHYMFSCGEGRLFEGSRETIIAQLTEAKEKEPDEAKQKLLDDGLQLFKRHTNPTQEFRNRVTSTQAPGAEVEPHGSAPAPRKS